MTQAVTRAAAAVGSSGGAAGYLGGGSANTDMQQEVDGRQKNVQALKEITSALGG